MIVIVWWVDVASGWDQVGATWPEMPVSYWVAEDLGPVDDGETLAAITAAFDTWAAVDCAEVTFRYEGRAAAGFGVVDGKNTVSLVAAGWPEDPALVSLPALTSDGAEMLEADVAVNTEDHVWVLDGADGRTRLDLQAGITHEIGHLLGLWHSTDPEATLNPLLAGDPDARTLSDDDIEGICVLYPIGAANGEGRLGDGCTETADCASPNQCVADGAERYCAPACPDGTCPDAYTCLEAGDGAVCAKAVGCGCTTTPDGSAAVFGLWLGAMLVRRRRNVLVTA